MLDIAFSLLPIMLFVLLLVGFHQTSARASFFSLCCALLVGCLRFSAEGRALWWEGVMGAWNAFTIFTVIAPAILIYELLLKAGMFEHIKNAVERVIRDDLLRVLFIGWTFSSFLQSITGFGVPVAVAAPILVSLGVAPVKSVMICILGHAWGGTFGTLAIAWDSLFLQAPEAAAYSNITLYACLMLWVYNLACGLFICFLHKGKRTRGRDLLTVVLISAVQGGMQMLFAGYTSSTACFLASALAILAVLLLNHIFYGTPGPARPAPPGEPKLWHMVFPFSVLTLLVVACLFVAPVRACLAQWKIGFFLPPDLGGALYSPIAVLTHSGTLLLEAGLVTLACFRRKGYLDKKKTNTAVMEAMKKAGVSIVPIFFLIVMSKVMDGTGQISVLAQGIAGLMGTSYPIFAPFVGILGSFISSSNMSSNLLFAGFQTQVAQLLAMDPGAILAAQTVGGSIGNLTATSNIVLGLATTGAQGQEGQVMKAMLPAALVCGVVCGVMTLLFCLYAA